MQIPIRFASATEATRKKATLFVAFLFVKKARFPRFSDKTKEEYAEADHMRPAHRTVHESYTKFLKICILVIACADMKSAKTRMVA